MSVYLGQQLFFKARLAAVREDLLARLTGRPADLLPFERVVKVLHSYDREPLPGVQSIPLDRIVGSTGRYRDFTRRFFPRAAVSYERWVRLDVAMASMEGVPPIKVFEIGGVYFVSDGNHRVSVARASGFSEIDAYVTRVHVDMDLDPGDSLDEVLRKAARANLLMRGADS